MLHKLHTIYIHKWDKVYVAITITKFQPVLLEDLPLPCGILKLHQDCLVEEWLFTFEDYLNDNNVVWK